jgi:hypothetical protein
VENDMAQAALAHEEAGQVARRREAIVESANELV